MTTEYSSSPDRGYFFKSSLKRQHDDGTMTKEVYDSWMNILDQEESRKDQASKTCNLEYDLRSNQTILEKCRSSKIYAQNLYAAMCNNDFFYSDCEEPWGCSWRYAGGIIADMRQEGDYIDWYCSGIIDKNNGYVGESFVTDEIRNDLLSMGWTIESFDSRRENYDTN
jgi:hypothetical protein